MTTTQYIRSQQGTEGTIVVTARAVDPEGNIIVETYNIAVTPLPKKYVQLQVSFTSVQLPDVQVNTFGNIIPFPGELIITPATLNITRTDTQQDGVFVKDAVGSAVTLSFSNIDTRVRFVGWEVGGQQVATSPTYVLTVPDKDPVNIVGRFTA
jgi:hypothetical protein